MDGICATCHALTRTSVQCCKTWSSQHLKGWKVNYAILFFISLLGPEVGKIQMRPKLWLCGFKIYGYCQVWEARTPAGLLSTACFKTSHLLGIYSFPHPELSSAVFIKPMFMPLVLICERNLLKQSFSLPSVLWHGCLFCHHTWKVKTKFWKPLAFEIFQVFQKPGW